VVESQQKKKKREEQRRVKTTERRTNCSVPVAVCAKVGSPCNQKKPMSLKALLFDLDGTVAGEYCLLPRLCCVRVPTRSVAPSVHIRANTVTPSRFLTNNVLAWLARAISDFEFR
jgi:hypothetical protein